MIPERVYIEIVGLIALFGSFLGWYARAWWKRSTDREAFDRKNLFTREDWLKERDDMRREHDEHVEEKVAGVIRYYEEKIEKLIAIHKMERAADRVEIESMKSKIRFLSTELRRWEKAAPDRHRQLRHSEDGETTETPEKA